MNGNKSIKRKILTIKQYCKIRINTNNIWGCIMVWTEKIIHFVRGCDNDYNCKILKPRLSLFVLDVDGVYSDLKAKKLIHDFKKEKPEIIDNKMDVTGGMTRKITEANKMAKVGLKVFFVNGNKPKRIGDAVSGKKFGRDFI